MGNLRHLEVFVQVARLASLSAAAQELGVTPSTISKVIAQLERGYGVLLFQRNTRRVALTSEGRILLEGARRALADLKAAEDALHVARDEPEGLVRLWSSAALGKAFIVPMMPAFFERYPKIDVEIRLDDATPDSARFAFDLAVQHCAISDQSYVLRRLCELPLALVASPKYLSRHGIPRTPDDLLRHQCVNIRQSDGSLSAWELRPPGAAPDTPPVRIVPRARMVIAHDYSALLNAALSGAGVTMLFAQSVRRLLAKGTLRTLLPDWEFRNCNPDGSEIYLRYPNRDLMPYHARVLAEFIAERLGDPTLSQFDGRPWAA
ncbi:MAG: LysR substrate-binding domain-containing protein [Gammaproteobacteria bacterium]